MTDLKVFKSSEFGELGVMTVNGKEYFPATQCAKVLGYAKPADAIRKHCKGVLKMETPTAGGIQQVNYNRHVITQINKFISLETPSISLLILVNLLLYFLNFGAKHKHAIIVKSNNMPTPALLPMPRIKSTIINGANATVIKFIIAVISSLYFFTDLLSFIKFLL